MAAPVDDPRARLIRLVHVGRRELRLDDDTYRALLASTVGKDSSSAMTVLELERVVSAMKKRGFKVRQKAGTRTQARDPVSSKIRALWLDLHAAGYVDDPSEKALNAYVMRSSGIADLHWITGGQATKVIEELKKWRRRDIGRIAKLMNKVRSKGVAMPLYRGEDARFVAHVCEAVTGSRDDGRANLEAVIRHLEALLNG